jgi:endonuclease/exonuclease/phosphatase family metal-dependent hydrolase
VADARSKVTPLSWAVAGGLAAWAAARVAAADRVRRTEYPAVPVLAFTPLVASAAPWVTVGLVLAGRRGPAATAAGAAAALGLVVGPRGCPRPQPAAGGRVLRVLTLNMFVGRADAEVVVARVRQAEADVLFLQELTAAAVGRLRQAGLDALLPHSRIELKAASGIYARFPLSEASVRQAQPTALLGLPGGEAVELVCVHPRPPTRKHGGTGRWREALAGLPPPGAVPRVVAGDFNATQDHVLFRAVLRLGYVDAAAQAGTGLIPTWGPRGRNALLTLDHVLVDRSCAVLNCSVHFIPGSDHRAVCAEIRLP